MYSINYVASIIPNSHHYCQEVYRILVVIRYLVVDDHGLVAVDRSPLDLRQCLFDWPG